MILAIDVGNTNIVLGCIEAGKIEHIVRLHTDANQTDAEYAVKLKQLFDLYGVRAADFEGAIYSSVVPPINRALLAAVRAVTGLDCMVVGPGIKTGLNLRVDDPGTVAGDLVVGAVAAIHCYGSPALVMDLGTATTITVIDRDNGFRGGAIMPGVKLGMAALASGTSLLPDISIAAPKKVIGTNTVDCMRSAAVYGTAAAIDGMIDRMEEELGYPCRHVATGGLAQAIVACCRHEIVCDDDLLLKGLWIIWEKNRK
jgi:type III pantothenate kinase